MVLDLQSTADLELLNPKLIIASDDDEDIDEGDTDDEDELDEDLLDDPEEDEEIA
jgi:hypothetical protein